MVTGRTAFSGATRASLIGAILRDEPAADLARAAALAAGARSRGRDLSRQRAGGALADRARRRAADRGHPAGPLASEPVAAVPPRRRRLSGALPWAIAAIAVAIALFRFPPARGRRLASRVMRTFLLPPPGTIFEYSANSAPAAVSPDGRHRLRRPRGGRQVAPLDPRPGRARGLCRCQAEKARSSLLVSGLALHRFLRERSAEGRRRVSVAAAAPGPRDRHPRSAGRNLGAGRNDPLFARESGVSAEGLRRGRRHRRGVAARRGTRNRTGGRAFSRTDATTSSRSASRVPETPARRSPARPSWRHSTAQRSGRSSPTIRVPPTRRRVSCSSCGQRTSWQRPAIRSLWRSRASRPL